MSDRLTLVVFKDHLSSRTLTVHPAWLRAFALVFLSVIGLAVVAGSLFFNAYRKTITSGSLGTTIKVEEIEKELAEIKASYESLKQQALNTASGKSTALGGSSNSFMGLPPDAILEPLPAAESLPFRLESLTAEWKGNHLQIRSAIEYTRDDGGNQQGHFVILARGPQSLIGYPEGVFNSAGTPSLIRPDSGEFFSVSRYREVKADFGPFAHREDVQSIEIFIFDPRKRLIYLNRIGLESVRPKTSTQKKAEAPKPQQVTAPPKAEEVQEATPAPTPETVPTGSPSDEGKPSE